MGKRKNTVPVRVDEEKRKCLAWNMSDGVSGQGSLSICSDNELEVHQQSNNVGKSSHTVPCATSSKDIDNLSSDETAFNSILENCLFYLTIHREVKLKPLEWHKQIATFSIFIKENILNYDLVEEFFGKTEKLWLYVGDEGCESCIYTENLSCDQKKFQFWYIKIDLPPEVLEAFEEEKIFQLVVGEYCQTTQSVDIVVFLRQAALVDLKFACEPVKIKKHSVAIQNVIGHFYGIKQKVHSGDLNKNHDIEELYSEVKDYHYKREIISKYQRQSSVEIQHQNLIPQLRPYQKDAVRWMLYQESDVYCENDKGLHRLFQLITLPDGTVLYYNKLVASLTLKRYDVGKRLPGGILADEMGLGKTVEVLACMMLHPRTDLICTGKSETNQEVLSSDLDKEKVESKHHGPPDSSELTNNDTESMNSLKTDDTHTSVDEVTCGKTSSKSSIEIMDTSVGDSTLTTDHELQSADSENIDESSLQKTKVTNKMNRLQKRVSAVQSISVGPKEFFECICGAKRGQTSRYERNEVQCIKCGLWQHAECVNFEAKDPSSPEFKCPHCLVRSPPVKSGATLIISPSSICYQWAEEITTHIKNQALSVFIYTGVHKQGFIQPSTLASHDIVITTYETLRKEIDYVDLPHSNSENGRKFRHPKRFMATPSPIIAVEWWRICLDEAQMVESTTTKTALMALRLTAVNRWCVTGTPIQTGVEDLYGLFLFLGIDPFWVKQWFDTILCTPLWYGITRPMYDTVSSVLWRTVKKDVINQINIPDQTEHVHWLTFTPVEDHFYRRQYHDSVRDSMKKLSKWTDRSTKLSSLDKHTVTQLMLPLLRLRQACCHPQAVRGEFLPLQKSTMTMDELLESLTKKAKTECEEAHRQIVAALNGQAGIHFIHDEYVEAVNKYREVLRSVEEHKSQLRTDELQQLHTLHNLQEIITLKPSGLEPTLRDCQLKEQADDIRHKYMAKAESKVTTAQQHLKFVQDNLQEIKHQFLQGSEWWLEVMDHAADRQIDRELIYHVQTELSDNAGELGPHISIANMFTDTRGLELVIEQRLELFESAHQQLMIAVNKLSQGLTPSIIHTTVECCLRPTGEVADKCLFCETDSLFQDYESKLYSFTEQGLVVSADQYQVGTRRQGTWADSQMEKSLKAILSFARQQRFDRDVIEFGLLHIKIFDGMKKEFKGLRAVWMSLREQVSSVDELEMAITRLRLKVQDEAEETSLQPNVIEQIAVPQQKQKLKSDEIVGKCELRKKLGQLLYLTNLAKTQKDNPDGHNPELCPICQKELGVEWSVMHCGHCYCLDCIRILLDQYSFGGRNRVVKCAICREKTYRSDVSFVSTKTSVDDEANYNIQGSHSTKVNGIVKQIIKIHQKDPTAKILIFSTWIDVLNVLATALTENNIQHRILFHGAKFQQNLSTFKQDKDVIALLLPVHTGANGLNIIEATYVIFMEPILNHAVELQAIGRVHRIGQTKPTEVHRFLVRGTIEQKMYRMLKSTESVHSNHESDENPLTIGDLTSLLSEESRDQDQPNDENQIENEAMLDNENNTDQEHLVQSSPEIHVTENVRDDTPNTLNEVQLTAGSTENTPDVHTEMVENEINMNQTEHIMDSASNEILGTLNVIDEEHDLEESVVEISELHEEHVLEESVVDISELHEEHVLEESVVDISELHAETIENDIEENRVEYIMDQAENVVEVHVDQTENVEVNVGRAENVVEVHVDQIENVEENMCQAENVVEVNVDQSENVVEVNVDQSENVVEVNVDQSENVVEVNVDQSENVEVNGDQSENVEINVDPVEQSVIPTENIVE